MERRFSQLRWKDRLRIEKMLEEGRKVQEIADALRVHNSTIYREIKPGMTSRRRSPMRSTCTPPPSTGRSSGGRRGK